VGLPARRHRAGDGGRRVAGWTTLAAGVAALAAGTTLAVAPPRPPADAGTLPAAAPAGAPSLLPPSPSGSAAGSPAAPAGPSGRSDGPSGDGPSGDGSAAADAARSAAAAAGAARPAPASPSRVLVPHLSVDAPVDPAGVLPGGELDVPADGERLGWWIGSAAPGADRGAVLIAGHVDTVDDGPGALYALERLPMGSRVEVRTGDREVTYRVVARRSYAKSRLPADLFRAGGPPRLALVTCGGAFRDGSYDRNVVVYAEPVGG
jgi:hypothetical protein